MMEKQIENGAAPAQEAAVPAQPGAMLREARERLGLSVADAAAQTKLAPRQIEALEADDYGQLPEMAFVRGFVRSYAKILHLDEQPLLAALPEARLSTQVSPTSVEVPFPDARSPQVQNLIWLGAALFLSVIVVAFAVWHYTSPGVPDKAIEAAPVDTAIPLPAQMQVIPASAVAETAASSVAPTAPVAHSAVAAARAMSAPVATMPVAKLPQSAPAVKPVQSVTAVKPVPATPAAKPAQSVVAPATKPLAPAAKPAAPAAAPKAATESISLRLTFGEESWTEVRDKNGNIVSSQLNPAGSELRLSGQGPYSLVVGRASSARLNYKGKTVDMKPHTNATSDVARLMLE